MAKLSKELIQTQIEQEGGEKKVRSLLFANKDIDDISEMAGFTHLPNLKSIGLMQCYIKDLTPLAGFTQITELRLSDNEIGDITPLQGMTNLEVLSLDQNCIENIDAIKSMACLRHLNLSRNRLKSVEALSESRSLITLNISRNPIADIRCLSSLDNIVGIDIEGTPEAKLMPDGMEGRDYLYLLNTPRIGLIGGLDLGVYLEVSDMGVSWVVDTTDGDRGEGNVYTERVHTCLAIELIKHARKKDEELKHYEWLCSERADTTMKLFPNFDEHYTRILFFETASKLAFKGNDILLRTYRHNLEFIFMNFKYKDVDDNFVELYVEDIGEIANAITKHTEYTLQEKFRDPWLGR